MDTPRGAFLYLEFVYNFPFLRSHSPILHWWGEIIWREGVEKNEKTKKSHNRPWVT